MSTTVRLKVTQQVALKIYTNYLKEYVLLKPWIGQGGCTWLAFDGTPWAGPLEDQSKTVTVEAEVNIPGDVKTLTKEDLLKFYTRRGGTVVTRGYKRTNQDKKAERGMWDDVSNQALASSTGLLVVEVGNTQFSSAPGKFLLVANKAMKEIKPTEIQIQALHDQLLPQEIKKLNDKIEESNKSKPKSISLVWEVRPTKARKDEFTNAFKQLLDGCSFKDSYEFSQETPKKSGQKHWNLALRLSADHERYTTAKQQARVIYPIFLRFKEKWKQSSETQTLTMFFGQFVYTLGDNSVKKEWEYKDQPGVHTPPRGVSLLKAG